MDDTPNLTLPFIVTGQAQKHVTHNEAIRMLDAVVQLSVLDRDLNAPPGSPADGNRYIVAASATGTWAGKDGQVAAWQNNGWMFYPPNEGWVAWVADEDKLLVWDGVIWNEVSGGGGNVNPTPLVGINTTADAANRLSVLSPNVLFTHEGSDIRTKLNKNTVADTASFLYQTGFSGRAEIGLTGDDDFHFKVSPDGSIWSDALIIDKDNGTTRAKRILSQTIIVADDTVGTITPPYMGGIVVLANNIPGAPQANQSGILSFDVGTTLNLITLALGPGMTNQGTVNLTGTTGPDGSVNMSVQTNAIQIENRIGYAAAVMTATFLG